MAGMGPIPILSTTVLSDTYIIQGLETAHIRTYKTARNPHCALSSGSSKANRVGLQAHSGRHESSRVILLSSLYLQVVVEVCLGFFTG